jgi:hypothetical protein
MGRGEEGWKLQDLMEDGKFLASLGRRYDFQVGKFLFRKVSFRLSDHSSHKKTIPCQAGAAHVKSKIASARFEDKCHVVRT